MVAVEYWSSGIGSYNLLPTMLQPLPTKWATLGPMVQGHILKDCLRREIISFQGLLVDNNALWRLFHHLHQLFLKPLLKQKIVK